MDPGNEEREAGSPGRVRRKPRAGARRAGPLLLFLLAALLLAGGFAAHRVLFSGDAASGGPVTVTIEEGDTLSAAAGKLAAAGVIGSARVFEWRARLRGLGAEIKPGEYRIGPGEPEGEVLDRITSAGGALAAGVTVPEGLTLGQTAERVAAQSGVSEAEFRREARRVDYGYDFLEGSAARSTEGFLFPKRYEFAEDAGARRMVERMLEQYRLETRSLDFGRARRELGLTEYQVVTVASLIEREAAAPEERPVIASVIYNRLREDMPLQIDATVQYALGAPKERLSLRDLEVDSPYNTYENMGLPPGPIASPGLDSIESALDPADTEYRYYVLDRNGERHTFTEGYEEFLRAKERAGR